MALLQNLRFAVYLCEELAIVQRKPDLGERPSFSRIREQRSLQRLEPILGDC